MRDLLTAVPGVQQAKVNFDKEMATVSFDSSKTNVDELVAALRRGGYKSWDVSSEN